MAKFLWAVLCLFLITPAYAEDKATSETPVAEESAENAEETTAPAELIEPVEIKRLSEKEIFQVETKGLYKTASEGGFGRNMWDGSTRADITYLIENMPANAKEPLINKMILGVLLTEANTKKLEHDGDIDVDLLTLRLEKLIEAGAYTQAYELYTSTGKEPYSERVARAAILAMLFSGEKSNACLETNIYGPAFADQNFWSTLSNYCTAYLAETPDPALFKDQENSIPAQMALDTKFVFPYHEKTFAKLKTLDRALIASENRFDISKINPDTVPLADLQIMLRHKSLLPEHKLKLTAKAVAFGLMPKENLAKLFMALKKSEKISTENQPPREAWHHLIYSYAKIQETDLTEHWAIIKDALEHFDTLAPELFQPFAETISRISPKDMSVDEGLKLYKIMISAGKDIPRNLRKLSNFEKKSKKNEISRFLRDTAALFSDGKPLSSKDFEEKLAKTHLHKKDISLLFLINIMKNIDKVSNLSHDMPTYEKDFFLTPVSDYVMPSVSVWDRLKRTKTKKAIGETILLSTYLMHEQDLYRAYPGLLRDVVLSIRHFNLTKLSNDLLLKALLDSNENNKEK